MKERTKALQDALRRYVEQAVKNPTFGCAVRTVRT